MADQHKILRGLWKTTPDYHNQPAFILARDTRTPSRAHIINTENTSTFSAEHA